MVYNVKNLIIATLLFVNALYAQPSNYLISINIENQNKNNLEKLELVVLHQFENVLLTITNNDLLGKLRGENISFKILDENTSDKDYYLISNKKRFDEINISSGKVIYQDTENLLVSNPSLTEIRNKGFSYTLIKNKPFSYKTGDPICSFQTSNLLDSTITNLIEDVDPDSLEYFIQSLQDFGSRFLLAPNRRQVAEWIRHEFLRFGIEDVKLDSFIVSGTWQYNVIATIPASQQTDKVYVIGGHHDSITSSSDRENNAPGADDNASGTTGVLEMARVLMKNDYSPEANLKFVTFAAEEWGLYGSKDFAKKAKNSGMNIKLMINHDMISYSPYQVSFSNVDINYYSGSEEYSYIAQECVSKYTDLNVFEGTSNSGGSDSYSFYAEGFNAVYFEEHNFTPYYHTGNDVIENSNIPFCTEVIKASCATLITSMVVPSMLKDIEISDYGNDGSSILIEWENNEENLAEFKVSVGLSSGSYIQDFTTTENRIIINDLINGTDYFIGVSVINLNGYESGIFEKRFTPFKFTLDQGILIVDETKDGIGTMMNPTDENVDDFFKNILEHFPTSDFDVAEHSGVNVFDLGNYSTIIWHGCDLNNLTTAYQTIDGLKRFLKSGGNLIYTGYIPSKAFEGNNTFPMDFSENDFIYDYLKIAHVEKKPGSRFSGAFSGTQEYMDIFVDTTKIKTSLNNHLSNIESIHASQEGSEIFYYNSKYDSSTVAGSMQNQPVGVEYIGEDYKVITLSFPLYYMEMEQARQLIEKVLSQKFEEPTSVHYTESFPKEFYLAQNYPNPFNPTTKINYTIPYGNSIVKLKIYNVLGIEIATLVNEVQPAGSYEVEFDAANFSSGIYFYTINTNQFSETKKMILLR